MSNMNFFSKLKFIFKKPKIVIVMSNNQKMTKKIISQILGHSFKVEKEVLFVSNIEKMNLSKKKYLILNFDNNSSREIREGTSTTKVLTFGFQDGADFQATNIKENGGTNFKINYQGNTIPIWLNESFNQKEIYSILAAIAVGTIFDLNLVEISQVLKNYQGLLEK